MAETVPKKPRGEDADPPITGNPSTWVAFSLRWIFGQPSIVVALFAILGAMVYITHQAGTVWVPSHLGQIQAGYERAIDRFDAARTREIEADRESHKELIDLLREDGRLNKSRVEAIEKGVEGLGP